MSPASLTHGAIMELKTVHTSISLLCLLLGGPVHSSGQEMIPGPQAIDRNPSVVMVLAYNKETGTHQQATGFFLNQFGDVVTNYHVVNGVDTVKIWTAADQGFAVDNILSVDIPADLAILSVKIPSHFVSSVAIKGQLPEAGDSVEVVGYPLGEQQTSTQGVVASIFLVPQIEALIQFTAPLASGGSGSPLFNQAGQVVGIASFILYVGPNRAPRYFASPAGRLLSLQTSATRSLGKPLL